MGDRISIQRLREHANEGGYGVERPSTLLALLDAVEATQTLDALMDKPFNEHVGDDYWDDLNLAFTRKRMMFARFDFGDDQ